MNNIILTPPDELENLIQSSIRKVLSEQNIATHKVSNEKFLTIKEAAEYLNLAEQTLYGYTSKGLIPFIKRAKYVLFLRTDLEKWLKQGRKLTLQETKEKSIREGKICTQ